MRVRHLRSHLQDQQLIYTEPLDSLRGLKIGVDAIYWLRSIQALKDPFADALGGVPPGIFGFVEKEVELFRKHDILPIFVFEGMAPGPQHSMFICRMDHQMEQAWTYLAQGQKAEAQKCFAVSTSRINGDFVFFIYHHLKAMGCEVFQAPYFASAQLSHFQEQGVVHSVFGPPGMLLYTAASLIIQMDFHQNAFEWCQLELVLSKWAINKEQFMDACLLAGTEYCLTYPYLNLGHFQQATNNTRFNFDAAVSCIKQGPLMTWMRTFPTEEMRNDHMDGYCICKLLVQSSPVMHMPENRVRPLGGALSNTNGGLQVPQDFSTILGDQLPSALYYLMIDGVISHKLPHALAKGEWMDMSQPLVDTVEFRTLITDLQDYRQRALGLIARHLNPGFMKKNIVCKAYWDPPDRQWHTHKTQPRVMQPKRLKRGLRWRISHEAVHNEMKRQGVDKVDFKFCLQWHANEYVTEGQLIKDITKFGEPMFTNDPHALAALVHFMLLEQIELIAPEDGGMTVLGNVLKDSHWRLQEPCLVALEMMKFGVLSGEPFDAPPERHFPPQVKYPKAPIDTLRKSHFLLQRVCSLVPMRLRNDMWNADVDFDLAAFHSLVRIVKRSLRQLTEASVTSVLLKDIQRVRLLPPEFMAPSPRRDDPTRSTALLPTFMLPRACMGIVAKFFLEYREDPKHFDRELAMAFPCCIAPREDLKLAFLFWDDLKRCVFEISEPLGAEDLAEDMRAASIILARQQRRLGVYPDDPYKQQHQHQHQQQQYHSHPGMWRGYRK